MQKFSQFTKNFAFSESLNSVLCRKSLDTILKKLNESVSSYAVIVPQPTSIHSTLDFLKSKDVPVYPLVYCNESSGIKYRVFLTIKPSAKSNEDFRNSLSDIYYESKDFAVVYCGENCTKILAEEKIIAEDGVIGSCEKLESKISPMSGVRILGIEVPTDAKSKLAFKKQGLLIYPSYDPDTAIPAS